MQKAAAFFDVDGTLAGINIVEYYLFFLERTKSRPIRCLMWPILLIKAIYFVVLDYFSRSRFNIAFYKNYRGFEVCQLKALSQECFETLLKPRLHGSLLKRLKNHAQNGERVVLVTGSLDFIVKPLCEYLGVPDLICASMKEENGCFTGDLRRKPVGEEEKGRLVRNFAEKNNIDLSESVAYGDSFSDIEMMECVGHAVAVNPDHRLQRRAKMRAWEILQID